MENKSNNQNSSETTQPIQPPENPSSLSAQPVTKTPSTPTPLNMKWILIFLGVLELIFPTITAFTVIPLISINKSLGTSQLTSYFALVFCLLLLLIAATQIVTGLFSFGEKLGKKKTELLIGGGIILSVLLIPVILTSVINTIYQDISGLGFTPSPTPIMTISNSLCRDPHAF